MGYDSPKELLSDIAEGMTFDKRLDPDKEPCFTQKRKVPGTDIVTYKVEDSQKGQRAVRAFVDSHWGVNANPWCLITRNTDAWHYWNHYNYLQKRIAFQNGKLLAFKACDEEGKGTPWWNRKDECSAGFPYKKEIGDGKYIPLVVSERSVNPIGSYPDVAYRGKRGSNLYEEWTPDGQQILLRETNDEHYTNTFESWAKDGTRLTRRLFGNRYSKDEQWYPNGKPKSLSIRSEK